MTGQKLSPIARRGLVHGRAVVFNGPMPPDRRCSLFAILMAPLLAQAAVAPRASVNRDPAAARIECFAASDMVRVFEDGFGEQKERRREIELFGLRNETISAQFVIVAGEALNNVRVSVGPLTREDGPETIAGNNVSWNFVQPILIEKNTPNRRAGGVIRPAPAWFPDCLSAERECSIAAGARKAVYLTIKIPAEVPADISTRHLQSPGIFANCIPGGISLLRAIPIRWKDGLCLRRVTRCTRSKWTGLHGIFHCEISVIIFKAFEPPSKRSKPPIKF